MGFIKYKKNLVTSKDDRGVPFFADDCGYVIASAGRSFWWNGERVVLEPSFGIYRPKSGYFGCTKLTQTTKRNVLIEGISAFTKVHSGETGIILYVDCAVTVERLTKPENTFGEWLLVAEASLRDYLKANYRTIAVCHISRGRLLRGIQQCQSISGQRLIKSE